MAIMTANGTNSIQKQPAANTCCCPACTGIECLDRPTFFAGQLLNEADLNATVEYAREKNRLHNRYLHGPGTVCGLEVTCGDCDGTVIIAPGYAIDPCGNDIILCSAQPFDVIKAINACAKARKKNSTTGCQPYQPPTPNCASDITTKWCITLEYKESPAAAITPLVNQKSSCGCGCGSKSTSSCGCSSKAPATAATNATQTCQPTRSHEGYSVGVCEDPGDCGALAGLMKGTLYDRVVKCFGGMYKLGTKRLAMKHVSVMAGAMTSGWATVSETDARDTCCRLLLFLDDLFSNSPFPVRCQLLHTLGKLRCPKSRDEQDYNGEDVRTNLRDMVALLVEYMRECVCHALLPPCPSDPCDDRLIIACVTVRNGKILDICNFGRRDFAGSFPSLYYWISLVPVVPLIQYAVDRLCCGESLLHANSPLVNELTAWLDKIDPSGSAREAVTAGNFAMVQVYLDRLKAAPARFSASQLANLFTAGSLNLAPLTGQTLSTAGATLAQSNVTYVETKVNSLSDIPSSLTPPVAQPGEKVIVYTDGIKILDIRPYPVQQQLSDQVQQINDLHLQLTALHATVAKLQVPPVANQ